MDVDILGTMLSAAEMLLQPKILFYIALGTFFGTLLAAIPGIGAVMGLALLLPFTFSLDAVTAVAFLLSALAVMSTADSIPAILFGVPGTPSSMVTVLDGYPMAKRGEAGRALGAALSSSVVGGILGAMALVFVIPFIIPVLMAVTSAELLALCILGLSMVAVLSGSSMMKGLAAASIGILLALIGQDGQTATLRWTFGNIYLWDGLNILVVILGVYAIPELADLAIQRQSIAKGSDANAQFRGSGKGVRDTFDNFWLVARSSGISTALGTLPALGPSIIPWLVYSYATLTARDKQEFGRGDVRGVIASESANNATVGGSLLPTVALGIPGSAPMAILLGTFLLQGVAPGPDMLTKNLDFTYMMVWVIVLANVVGGIMAFGMSVQLARVVFVKSAILVPVIASVVFLGAVQASRQWEDIAFLLGIGVLGWVMKHASWPRSPLVLAFILSPLVEQYFHIAMNIHGWSWMLRPGVAAVLGITGVLIAAIAVRRLLKGLRRPNLPNRWRFQLRFGIETLLAAAVLVIAVAALISTQGWAHSAAMMPRLAAWVGAATAAACLVLTLLVRVIPPGGSDEEDDEVYYDVRSELDGMDPLVIALRGARFAALLGLFCVLAWTIGVVPALPAFLLVYMVVEGVRPAVAALVALGTAVVVYAVFVHTLALPWPRPLWDVLALVS